MAGKMSNMEWIRLAATGGRPEGGVQLASAKAGESPPALKAPTGQGTALSQPAQAPASDDIVKVDVTVAVDRFLSVLKDCTVAFTIKKGRRLLSSSPSGISKPDTSGNLEFSGIEISATGCRFEVNVFLPGSRAPGAPAVFVASTDIPGGCSGEVYFKISPVTKDRPVEITAESTDSTNRGSTTTTSEGSGSLSLGPLTIGGKGSQQETGPSLTDGGKRSRTDHFTVPDVMSVSVVFSQSQPSVVSNVEGPTAA